MKIKKLALVLAASASVVGLSAIGGAINNNSYMAPQALAASVETTSQVSFSSAGGDLEALYAEFNPVANAEGYNAYVKLDNASTFTKLDSQLVRTYNDGHIRVDAVGLAAGSYTLKVVPIINGAESTSAQAQRTGIAVKAHDRSGFGFVEGTGSVSKVTTDTSSGAYNDNGVLRSNADVIYITNSNKNTITYETVDKKGNAISVTGFQAIVLNMKSNTKCNPLDIRIIGNLDDPSELTKGDLSIDTVTAGLTIEGIGTDANINGFGIVLKNSSNVEIRNLGFMNCNSNEGDSIGLQQGNDHVWVHNNDIFYGDAGSDKDQIKGDGALDTKTSSFISHSYNHFWDTGKSNLQGMKSESTDNRITYHHNWYDHSDSRHPRIRTCTVHIYNNYFDGNAKYGVGMTMGGSAFVESNYFRSTSTMKPMLISMQGTDALGEGTFSSENGGIIKAFNNTFDGKVSFIPHTESSTSFDAYVATSRDEVVPESYVALQGGTSYNNFDTAADMYSYTVDTPEVAKANVEAYAGRVQGGDFQYDFDDATEDANYAVITELKTAIVNYTSSLSSVQNIGEVSTGETGDSGTETGGTETGETGETGESGESGTGETGETGETGTTTGNTNTAGLHVMTFMDNNTTDEAGYFTVSGNTSNSKGSVTYDGTTYSVCLKMESSTSINFTAGNAGKLTLVFDTPSKKVKVDGTSYTTDSNGILELELSAGAHTISKGDTMNLFYMSMNEEGASNNESEATTSVLLERQSSSNAIRYITTITGYAKSDIVSWNVTFNLNGTNVSTSNYSVLYLSVAGDNGKDSVENTYYLVFTMTDIPSSQNGNTLSCYMTITLSDDTTVQTNTVSDVLSIQ